MARYSRISKETKEQILAEYKAGASKKSLSRKYEISVGAIFKICKDAPQDNIELVNQQVAINTALSTQSEKEVKAFHEIVKDKTKHLIYFQNSALNNQKKANELLEYANELSELETHSKITARNKDVVCGKDITTQINNTNSNTEQKLIIERREINAK